MYDRGDTSGYHTHSEADFTLCLLLNYWTNGDAVQVDRLFRRSALMSVKWDRRAGHDSTGRVVTYGQLTITNAQQRGNPAPQPRGSWGTDRGGADSQRAVSGRSIGES